MIKAFFGILLFTAYLSGMPCEYAFASEPLNRRQEILSRYFDYPCAKFGIPKALALAIARQESGLDPLAVNVGGKSMHPSSLAEALRVAREAMSKGGSFDVGLMQINSRWIKRYNIPLEKLFEPGGNVYVGCWILRQEIQRHGLTWKAVGRYHSPTSRRAEAYASLIQRHLLDILRQ